MSVTQITCDGCGACCMGQNLLPMSGNILDKRDIPHDLVSDLMSIYHGPLVGDDKCPCVWLDRATGKCIHYDYRPTVCREMVVGGPDCLRIRREAGLEV